MRFGRLILTPPAGPGQEFLLGKSSITVGRSTASDVVLQDPSVSRSHTRLECSEQGCVMVDLSSSNGTGVNGVLLQTAALHPGDVITLGKSILRFEADAAEPDPGDAFLIEETGTPRLAIHTAAGTWEAALTEESILIGRDPESGIVIDSAQVSRQHARIERQGDSFLLRDLGGINGTWVGEQTIGEYTLGPGDTIRIGPARLTFKSGFVQEDLKAGDSKHRPVVLIPGFGHLVDYLEENLGYERGRDLLEFVYDSRLDVRSPARQLADALDEWNVEMPVTLIGHGLGCLVARYYVEQLGGKKKVERLILMGGPHLGAPGTLMNLLDFPSTYQVLPTYPCAADENGNPIRILEDDAWLPPERRPLLHNAREFRQELGTRSSVPAVCIFGYGLNTVTQVKGGIPILEPLGDSEIPECSAVMDGTAMHPVHQYHGALFADSDVKMRLKMELTR